MGRSKYHFPGELERRRNVRITIGALAIAAVAPFIYAGSRAASEYIQAEAGQSVAPLEHELSMRERMLAQNDIGYRLESSAALAEDAAEFIRRCVTIACDGCSEVTQRRDTHLAEARYPLRETWRCYDGPRIVWGAR